MKKTMNKLSTEQHHILFERGTEPAFTGKYWDNKEDGEYYCAACNAKLFSSKDKFDSGTGWPSFTKGGNLKTNKDFSLLVPRTEVICKNCGGHLGHVFNDGPKPACKRFCINSASLNFKKKG